MALTRTPHWATRELHQFFLDNAKAPFAWGTNDCGLFAANAIRSFTGVDIAAPLRGKYTDQAGAYEAIHAITGGTTVADAAAFCAAQAGLVELEHPLMAQRGDLVVMAQNAPSAQDQLMAGVVGLSGRDLITVAEQGPVRLPIGAVRRAWRV